MPSRPQEDDAMSTASTLVPPSEVRTTLTGRPIEYEHDNYSNILSGENSHVGANLLPPGYTDSSLVHIPIKTAEYISPTPAAASEIKREPQPRKGSSSVWSRLSGKVSGSGEGKGDDGGMRVVEMSRGEYLKYWVKGDDGKFRDSVVEPPEGRAEWLASALERQDKEGLGKLAPQRSRGAEGAFGAAGAMIGGVVN